MNDLERAVQAAAIKHHNLRRGEYRKMENPLGGMCYIASEALYHLSPNTYKGMNMVVGGVSHWFLVERSTGRIVDLTASQFSDTLDYSQAVGRGFLTRPPSKRAQVIMNEVTNA